MIHLEPCPFCGQELEQRHRRYNPYARCATDDCMGGKLPLISLDVPGDIERWNRRDREQALAAHVEGLQQELLRCASLLHCNFPSSDKNKAMRQDELAKVKRQRDKLREALEKIASCEPVVDGDVVSIARAVLAEMENGE